MAGAGTSSGVSSTRSPTTEGQPFSQQPASRQAGPLEAARAGLLQQQGPANFAQPQAQDFSKAAASGATWPEVNSASSNLQVS